MQQTEITVRMLVPEEGHLLTQSSPDIPMSRRVVAHGIDLAEGDSPEAWKEIPVEEAEALVREIHAAQQEEMRLAAEAREAARQEEYENKNGIPVISDSDNTALNY